jgi:WD40 repeat protein
MAAARQLPILVWEADTGKLRGTFGKGRPDHIVLCSALSPDGKGLAYALEDGAVASWDVRTGKEVFRFPPTAQQTRGVCFTPDGKKLLMLSSDGVFTFHDRASGHVVLRWRTNASPVHGFALSPDARTVAAAVGWTVSFREAVTGLERRRLAGQRDTDPWPSALAFSPDGKVLATGVRDQLIRLWAMDSGKELRHWECHREAITSLAFTPDGKMLASRGWDRTVRLWDVATGKPRHTWGGHQDEVLYLAFAGRMLASADYGHTLRLWDPNSGNERILEGAFAPNHWVGLAASPDGRLLATTGDEKVGIRLWDVASGKPLHGLGVPDDAVGPVAFTPDGKRLAALDSKGTLALWDVDGGKGVRRLGPAGDDNSRCLAFSPDGRWLATGGQDLEWRLWDVATGRPVHVLQDRHHVWTLAFSPDGRTVASGTYPSPAVRLWEVATGRLRAVLRLGNSGTALAFAPDGRTLLSGASRGGVSVYDLSGERPEVRVGSRVGPVWAIAFSRDGNVLAFGSNDTSVLLWDARRVLPRRGPPVVLPERELWALWGQLGGGDAERAYEAMWRLAAAPRQAADFLNNRLRPAPVPDEGQRRRIRRLIEELDSPRFAVRARAAQALEQIGEMGLPQLRAAAATGGLESRRRLEQLLKRLDGPVLTGERLRGVRAVEALEYMGSAEASAVLRRLAGGQAEARLTREVREGLGRLARQTRKG